MKNRIIEVLDQDRNRIAHRKMQLIEIGKLLRQYSNGAITFSDPIQTKANMREILHNGKGTGFCVNESLYNSVVGDRHPEQPKVSIKDDSLYELTPDLLEREWPSVFQYIEDCVLYLMMKHDLPADKVKMTITRTAFNELRYEFEAEDGNSNGTEQSG